MTTIEQLGLFAAAPEPALSSTPSKAHRARRVVMQPAVASVVEPIVEPSVPLADLRAAMPEVWVVFLGGMRGEAGRPAIVEAPTRPEAERRVSRACRVPLGSCFAVPAPQSVEAFLAIKLEEHKRFVEPPAEDLNVASEDAPPMLALGPNGVGIVEHREPTTEEDARMLDGLRGFVGAEYVMTTTTGEARELADVVRLGIRTAFAAKAGRHAAPQAEPGDESPRAADDKHEHPLTLTRRLQKNARKMLVEYEAMEDHLGDCRPILPPENLSMADIIERALRQQIAKLDAENEEVAAKLREFTGEEDPEVTRAKARQAEKDARKRPAPAAPVQLRGRHVRAKSADATAEERGQRGLTPRQQELLATVALEDGIVSYTGEGQIPDWKALKFTMELLGGVWKNSGKGKGGKVRKGGWKFSEGVDVEALLEKARADGTVFDATLLGLYPTSDVLADDLVAKLKIKPGDYVLEPEAGDGALARAVRRACPEARILCVEIMPENVAELERQGFKVIAGDFLKLGLGDMGPFDCVAMNPPFDAKRLPEVEHTRHAIGMLRGNGRLGAILPDGITYNPRCADFREELESHKAVITKNPDGSFKAAGTMTKTVSVVLTRAGTGSRGAA